MKLFWKGKDGGAESSVTGYWLIEWKDWFSIALLKFEGLSREAFHTHAFNSISWLLSGKLREYVETGKDFGVYYDYLPSLVPIITKRETFHKVNSDGTSWVLTFRGPWAESWQEYLPSEDRYRTLTHGRIEI